jgi:hypothetical protein
MVQPNNIGHQSLFLPCLLAGETLCEFFAHSAISYLY